MASTDRSADSRPDHFPQRIVCLTEEPTEVLYALGEERRIVGISGFTVRPPRARREKPIARSGSSFKISPIFALVNAETFGFSLRARDGRTVKPEMPTMRRSSPSA